jgi:REP element-mobilizing transposase RayT
MGAKAYFLTWTTYGTWLPGDVRGWVDRHRKHGEIVDPPDHKREEAARGAMKDEAVLLDETLRETARKAMMATAAYCGWLVHAMEVRSNHVHVVVTAADKPVGEVMRVLKAYASRELNKTYPGRQARWWTREGSKRMLFTDEALSAAIQYVKNQDAAWMKGY